MGSFRREREYGEPHLSQFTTPNGSLAPLGRGLGGGDETGTPVLVEPTLKYHPDLFEVLTLVHYLDRGQCMVGSLTGAVSSQSVTEELEGTLSTVGHRTDSAMA